MAKSVNVSGRMSVGRFEEEFEKTLIEEALKKTKGKKKEAAKLLGWGRNTLTRKIKEIGIK